MSAESPLTLWKERIKGCLALPFGIVLIGVIFLIHLVGGGDGPETPSGSQR